jgi:hypothetical protein
MEFLIAYAVLGLLPLGDTSTPPQGPSPGGPVMGWLIAYAVLGLLPLGACVALRVRHRARREELEAVIRAQRRCLDQMRSELACGCHQAGAPAQAAPGASRRCSRQAGYGIAPSVN